VGEENKKESMQQCPLCGEQFRVLLERITPEDAISDGQNFISEHGTCACGYNPQQEKEKKNR